MGKLTECLEHGDEVMALYDADKCRHLVDLLNHDPRSMVGGYLSQCTWMQGYPDRAVQLSEATVAHARRIGHPFDLGFTLYMDAGTHIFRREPEETRKRTQEFERLGRANSLPVLFALLAPENFALASLEEGDPAEALAQQNGFREKWLKRAPGNTLRTGSPIFVAMALDGQLDDALQLIDKQIEEIERPGREQRVHYAELLRIRGWMLTLKDDLAGAEQYYLASLDWAREQQAKSWELRSSTSLAKLWQSQGKRKEAHELLNPVYAWFTEGFGTRDLKEAKALLEELAT
jgi:hypothetical protein